MSDSETRRYTLALLLALTGTSAFSLQFFVPAMPALVGIFETTPAMVQLTLTLFLAAYGIFQAIYGPLSDRFGRKPVLVAAITIYIAGSFLGAAALSIEMVIIARVLQAVGAAAGFVLVPAIARDVYGRDGAPRAMGYISMTNGFISAAGPLVGGLIHQYAGWRYGLMATGALGVTMLLFTVLYLRESGTVIRQRVAIAVLARGYAALAKTRGFMGYVLSVASVNGVFYAFLAGAAFVAIENLGVSPSGFGLLMVPAVAMFMTASFFSDRLARRIGTTRVILIGTLFTATGAVGLLVVSLAGHQSVTALLIASAFMGLGNGQVLPACISEAVSVEPRLAGTASAWLGVSQMAVAAAASQIYGFIHDGTTLPVALLMTILAGGALGGWVLIARRNVAPATSA
ncbi:MAG: multidrug effflux MFS transporter [Proteobacteria bacterium]|nr:multidrug effflux MFS transporter [Pseudomonadota bacterium]MDA1057286.1 multidrug effflux MFS transporter [Pseudomonadota bacterium]